MPSFLLLQYLDSQLPGYTYDGLSEKESLDMVLWRPLFEGLAEGLKSTIATSESGVGCFIQRASILALRAIFLRHGNTFSSLQFSAILSETIIPAMQEAAEKDQSPVVSITSESPLISNIDFLVDSMPLPPAPDDAELLQFEVQNNRLERALGPSELMLEASFTDLRHGGDGDLRKAHKLAKKSPSDSLKATEQPFPDSWLATTASMALGLLTDITTEYVISRGPEGRERIWPIISEQYRLWYAGRVQKEENVSQSDGSNISSWAPCEALVRISCREILRLSNRFAMDYDVSSLPEEEKTTWSSLLLNFVSDLLAESLEQEEYLRVELLRLKMGNTHRKHEEKTEVSATSKQKAADESVVHTPFGKGKVVNRRRHEFHDEDFEYSSKVIMDVIALDFGATLYRPASVSIGEKILEEKSNGSAFSEDDGKCFHIQFTYSFQVASMSAKYTFVSSSIPLDLYWIKLVPALKIRCIAAHCLQQVLVDGCELFVSLATKDIMSTLLHNLQTSSLTSSSAVRDENISAAFQLVLLEEWGDGNLVPDDRTESSARFSLLHGSAVYFLSQEASAIKASISVLSMLYLNGEVEMAKKASVVNWNRANFAESHLVRTIQDVLEKFLESERKEGHLVDLNMWRNTNEIGAKVALYCTALAPIVVEALKILRSMSSDRFEKYKHIFFPLLCALIQVQSEEIRELVQQTFTVLVGPMIGVRAVP